MSSESPGSPRSRSHRNRKVTSATATERIITSSSSNSSPSSSSSSFFKFFFKNKNGVVVLPVTATPTAAKFDAAATDSIPILSSKPCLSARVFILSLLVTILVTYNLTLSRSSQRHHQSISRRSRRRPSSSSSLLFLDHHLDDIQQSCISAEDESQSCIIHEGPICYDGGNSLYVIVEDDDENDRVQEEEEEEEGGRDDADTDTTADDSSSGSSRRLQKGRIIKVLSRSSFFKDTSKYVHSSTPLKLRDPTVRPSRDKRAKEKEKEEDSSRSRKEGVEENENEDEDEATTRLRTLIREAGDEALRVMDPTQSTSPPPRFVHWLDGALYYTSLEPGWLSHPYHIASAVFPLWYAKQHNKTTMGRGSEISSSASSNSNTDNAKRNVDGDSLTEMETKGVYPPMDYLLWHTLRDDEEQEEEEDGGGGGGGNGNEALRYGVENLPEWIRNVWKLLTQSHSQLLFPEFLRKELHIGAVSKSPTSTSYSSPSSSSSSKQGALLCAPRGVITGLQPRLFANIRDANAFRSQAWALARTLSSSSSSATKADIHEEEDEVANKERVNRDHTSTTLSAEKLVKQHKPQPFPTRNTPHLLYPPRKISIIGRSTSRRIYQLEAVEKIIRATGVPYQWIETLDSYTWVEQVRIMRETGILVAAHGGDITNTLFLPPNAVLVELFPYMMNVPMYRQLADVMSVWYYRVSAGSRPIDPETVRGLYTKVQAIAKEQEEEEEEGEKTKESTMTAAAAASASSSSSFTPMQTNTGFDYFEDLEFQQLCEDPPQHVSSFDANQLQACNGRSKNAMINVDLQLFAKTLAMALDDIGCRPRSFTSLQNKALWAAQKALAKHEGMVSEEEEDDEEDDDNEEPTSSPKESKGRRKIDPFAGIRDMIARGELPSSRIHTKTKSGEMMMVVTMDDDGERDSSSSQSSSSQFPSSTFSPLLTIAGRKLAKELGIQLNPNARQQPIKGRRGKDTPDTGNKRNIHRSSWSEEEGEGEDIHLVRIRESSVQDYEDEENNDYDYIEHMLEGDDNSGMLINMAAKCTRVEGWRPLKDKNPWG